MTTKEFAAAIDSVRGVVAIEHFISFLKEKDYDFYIDTLAEMEIEFFQRRLEIIEDMYDNALDMYDKALSEIEMGL